MSETVKEKAEFKVLMLGLILLVILLIFASFTQSLIVEEGIEVEMDELLFELLLSTSLAIFSVAFINQGLSEDNDLLKIICFVVGFILVFSTLFGIDLLSLGLLGSLGSILVIEIFFLLALAFTITAVGIFVLRRI